MKKCFQWLALASVTMALPLDVAAQQVVEELAVVQIEDKYPVLTNSFWDNWFFSIGGGASVLMGDGDHAGKLGKRISPALSVAVGKWFTPGLGLRLQYNGLQAKGFTYNQSADYVRGRQLSGGYYKQRFDYMNLHGDVLFNVSALLGGYNSHRVYEFIPFLGAGFTHNYTRPRRQALALNTGTLQRFRLSDALSVNLEINTLLTEDKFDGEVGGSHGFDGMLNVTAGITYRFPARGFRRPVPQLISQAELALLQENLALMAAQNADLQQALTQAQNQPVAEVTEAEVVVPADIAPRTVFFRIGSAEISPREVMNLSYLAEQMKKFPEETYCVNGYADSATGSIEYNKLLSQKRAQAVADVLVHQYGIDAHRLKVDANGGVDQFGSPILNRVVLVKSAE